MLNTFGVQIVALLNDVSVWWHLLGVAVIVVLLFVAPHSHAHQSVSFVFGSKGYQEVAGFAWTAERGS
jgi:amino acid transporter